MSEPLFQTAGGRPVTAVTSDEMREVDRVAVDATGLELLQMMENAGRNLANAIKKRLHPGEEVVVLAGDGGNGGGGLACARHLVNHGVAVTVVLDRPATKLTGAAATQHGIIAAMPVPVVVDPTQFPAGDVVVDALVGYGLDGPLRDTPAKLVEAIAEGSTVVSLDIPTGRNATSGAEPGPAVDPDTVVTLALPKTGLAGLDCPLLLADIGIPAVVYDRLDIPNGCPFEGGYLLELVEC